MVINTQMIPTCLRRVKNEFNVVDVDRLLNPQNEIVMAKMPFISLADFG